ncbi:hypothetical protein PHLGIDRAFT_125669 [Phlebiopsis gigantea 11061_1 CR5-6]|uniref:Large ribosomal subunit protein mL46 n=1 Tax=Phlebiopsis gigantea (strain 11061_1 CR5-6) TaxID=745531 RepID=A0A0C3S3Y2_PHLG1|nr:hypothetical protein PHLGIDRAFT_125669 [Phlebiopsis gigantea 11061_1 CR5-6]
MFSRNALRAFRAQPKVHRVHAARALATAAESVPAPVAVPGEAPAPTPARSQWKKPVDNKRGEKDIVQTAVILNRSPTLSRTATAFERAYYSYQSRIQRALYNPLPTEFYFKPGSLLEGIFMKEENERERKAFGRPNLNPNFYKKEKAVELLPGQEEPPKLMPRITEADKKKDIKSLDRKGERNLYLLIQGKDEAGENVWRLPQSDVTETEVLYDAVQRELRSPYGFGMDTWVVSRKPVGVWRPTLPQDSADTRRFLFFYKAHILAGQVRPDGKSILDFAWLTKEEIEPRVDQYYWSGVKDMLSDF